MRYTEGRTGRTFVCRMDHDADLLGSITKFANEKEIFAGIFWAIGAVKKTKFSFYEQNQKKYQDEFFNEPMELLSCFGDIATLKGEIMAHIHGTFSKEDGKAIGGHVVEGTTMFAGELFIVELLGARLERSFDEVTGLNLYEPKKDE